jgi:hypothetical protein
MRLLAVESAGCRPLRFSYIQVVTGRKVNRRTAPVGHASGRNIMSLELVYKYLARTAFIIASAAIAVAFLQWLGDFAGFSLTGGVYTAGRLLELAAALLVFVIAVLLRQIRDELRSGRAA